MWETRTCHFDPAKGQVISVLWHSASIKICRSTNVSKLQIGPSIIVFFWNHSGHIPCMYNLSIHITRGSHVKVSKLPDRQPTLGHRQKIPAPPITQRVVLDNVSLELQMPILVRKAEPFLVAYHPNKERKKSLSTNSYIKLKKCLRSLSIRLPFKNPMSIWVPHRNASVSIRIKQIDSIYLTSERLSLIIMCC